MVQVKRSRVPFHGSTVQRDGIPAPLNRCRAPAGQVGVPPGFYTVLLRRFAVPVNRAPALGNRSTAPLGRPRVLFKHRMVSFGRATVPFRRFMAQGNQSTVLVSRAAVS